jgi:hypothetical protein
MNTNLKTLLSDKRLWLGPAPVLIVFLLLINLKVHADNQELERQHQAQLLMPILPGRMRNTDAATARYDASCGESIQTYWPYIPDATRQRLVVISGMSQMHAINDAKLGDEIISQCMDDAMMPHGVRVWGEAAPNLCNEEATMQMVSFFSNPKTTPSVFIYAVCFDKFRNVDLRPGYQQFMDGHPEISQAWRQTADQYAEKYPLASAKMLASLRAIQGATTAVRQDTFESRLRDKVGELVPLVGSRQDLNVMFSMQLGSMRNKVLGITPTSKRPIIQSRYDLNREFLALMADLCKDHHVQFIVYVIPLNPQADNPYVPSEYTAFKQWIAGFATERGLPFANLENVVPKDEWGEFNGGPDFKHFREEGHRRTAAAVIQTFGPWLLGTAQSSDVSAVRSVPQPSSP